MYYNCTNAEYLENIPAFEQIGDTLEEFLADATSDPKLRQCLMSLAEAVRTIAFKVRAGLIRTFGAGSWEPARDLQAC